MNINEAIVYSTCVQHFIRIDFMPTLIDVHEYAKQQNVALSEEQFRNVAAMAMLAIRANKEIIIEVEPIK